MSCLPVVEVDPASSPLVMGEAVLQGLENYRADVPHPDDVSVLIRPALEHLGFDSWQSLQQNAAMYDVEEADGDVVITPTKRDASGGYEFDAASAARCNRSADQIGRALITLIEAGAAR